MRHMRISGIEHPSEIFRKTKYDRNLESYTFSICSLRDNRFTSSGIHLVVDIQANSRTYRGMLEVNSPEKLRQVREKDRSQQKETSPRIDASFKFLYIFI